METITYKVQLGPFTKLEFAAIKKQELSERDFKSVIVKKDSWFYVQIGEFRDIEKAKELDDVLLLCGMHSWISIDDFEKVDCKEVEDATPQKQIDIKPFDKVKVAKDAKVYGTKNKFPDWVYTVDAIVRYVDNNCVTIGIFGTGPAIGSVHKKYLTKI